ncbi:vacuolar-sorting protein SNF8 [Microplitis mediator]|uniref:vacuolar-sorting protein SNF8 n=1 Tax=Microplitis mediator TaxID=375433 RepID=UPI002557379E|nr:vacuolar-sorting protein SNF8 [Microplitis mediator]
MRRKAGIGAIHKQKLEQEKYKDKGTAIQENQFEQMTKHMEMFRTNLEEFATKHKNEIKKNAQFRRQFTEMCASIGVDPLASGKGFWSVLGIGDFYYELAVQIVEVCLATNYKTGGLISLDELRDRLIQARGRRKEHQEITNEDLLAAAKKLRIFGSGFSVLPIGRGKYLVQSIPGELSMDHTAVLQQTSITGNGYASVSLLESELKWERDRAQKSLDHMVKLGLAWLDEQDDSEILYWFPSLFTACVDSNTC